MSFDQDADEGAGFGFLAHIPTMIRQRKLLVILPALIGLFAGLAAAFLLPARYQSKALLLVEAPQLPDEIAGGVENDLIDRRIARIRQQVLSRPGLIELIRKHGLYASDRSSKPLSEIVEDMREATAIEALTADVQQRGGGKSSTIAFSLTYDYSDPIKAQAVAQELTEQVLMIDSTKNAEQAANTVQFLTDQDNELKGQIVALESEIAGIKARNGMVLSGPSIAMGGGGSYDVQIAALQRDNATLNTQRDLSKSSATRDPMVAGAEASLAGLQSVYSETHPDVIIAKQRLEEAKQLAAKNVDKIPVDAIAKQIDFNNSQIAALQAAKAQDSARLSAALSAQSRGPVVMEQVAQLQQRLTALNEQHQVVSQRLMAAQAGAKAESEQKGERLSVIDPPVVPDEPSFPNRPLFMGGGIAVGLALGLLLVLAVELITQPIRDVDAVRRATGDVPLVVIPTISARSEPSVPWYRKLWPFRRRQALAQDA